MNGCPLPSETPRRAPCPVDTGSRHRLQPYGPQIFFKALIYNYFLPGISDGICTGAGFAPPDPEPQLSPCMNMPWTLPLSDSTRDTPVVISTLRRSPLSTFLHWVSTT